MTGEPGVSLVSVHPVEVTTIRWDIRCAECGGLAPADTEAEAIQWANHHRRGFHGEQVEESHR